MHVDDVPTLWHLRLTGGGLAHVWSDGYQEVDGAYVFDVLARAPMAFQAGVDILSSAPADPERVCVIVARIPMTAVIDIHTAKIGFDDPYCDCA